MSAYHRRQFLGALAASAAAGAARAQEAGAEIRTGFIGTGGRGTYLLKGTLAQPGVKVMAVCDIKPDRLDGAATVAARDNPATYSEWRRIIDRKDIDAVYIATPCDLHVEMAIAAFQAGKHVYCEKPIGVTPESVNRLWRVGKDSKVVFQTGLGSRSNARNRAVIAKIHEGIAGKVVMIKAQRTAGEDLDHNGRSADWFFFRERSGDVIVEMAVHNLDVCTWIADSRPQRASGVGGALVWPDLPPGRTNMDGYSVAYDYDNGVKLTFTQVFFHPNGMPAGGSGTSVYGTKGGVDMSSATYYPRERKAVPVKLMEGVEARASQSDEHIVGFLRAIRTGEKTTADLKVGCIATLTAILGRESVYRKKTVTWAELGVDL
jgi:myo-inositol 2-dehydrogenase / D-chiro-inositol 1-dehydrogenase